MLKSIFTLMLTVALGFSLSACTRGAEIIKKTTTKTTLNISYYNVKYGNDWINDIVTEFKKSNPEIIVNLSGDAQLNNKLSLLLGAQQTPDIIFASQTNWRYYAANGYLANLNGLYSTVIDNNKHFSEKIQPGFLNNFSYNGSYWVVPWGDGVTGLIYNSSLFKSNNWEVPTTVAELKVLITQMKAKNIQPFSWGGNDLDGWNDIVTGWWVQYEGENAIKDYLQMQGPQVYGQIGRLKGLETFNDLVCDVTNSIDNPLSADDNRVFSEFYSGKAAMLPGSYIYKTMTSNKPPVDFEMKMMRLPAIDGAKQADLDVSTSGDFAAIPAGAKNEKNAEKLIAFMSKDDMLSLFTLKTGSTRPFVYNAVGTKGLTGLTASAAELWQNDKKIYMYSLNPVYYSQFFDWPLSGSPLIQILSGNETAQSAFDKNVEYAQNNWDNAVRKYS